MVTVVKIGTQKRTIVSSIPGEPNQDGLAVTFREYSRGGSANSELSESSDALSRVLGVEAGIKIARTHTQLIPLAAASKLKEGQTLNLFINRTLVSMAAMKQQVDVPSRMIDGQPTYFVTSLSEEQKPDKDLRMSNETLAHVHPDAFKNVRVGVAEVIIEEEQSIVSAVS